ncbi:hypothetical protein DFH07DRAFT_1032143 [Mycena maculata]|uniref:Uncharacterized protein n=1 Tax=Mycena maculata TaxID=230809 RepID=A0AAD7IYE1_9AGAR|nr:hypothetical protein DFH07DRAFT_1032143 [Mycena maculata]
MNHSKALVHSSWEAQFVCDVAVFTFTPIRSYREPFKSPGSLLGFLVRDGKYSALYFAVLALVNLANILTYYFGDVNFILQADAQTMKTLRSPGSQEIWPRSPQGKHCRYSLVYESHELVMVMASLSVTLMSRLMLNLHQAADLGILTETTVFTTVIFQSGDNVPGGEV